MTLDKPAEGNSRAAMLYVAALFVICFVLFCTLRQSEKPKSGEAAPQSENEIDPFEIAPSASPPGKPAPAPPTDTAKSALYAPLLPDASTAE